MFVRSEHGRKISCGLCAKTVKVDLKIVALFNKPFEFFGHDG